MLSRCLFIATETLRQSYTTERPCFRKVRERKREGKDWRDISVGRDLPYKCEDQSSDPGTHVKQAGIAAACNPSIS